MNIAYKNLIDTYESFILMYVTNQYNIVKQLSSN